MACYGESFALLLRASSVRFNYCVEVRHEATAPIGSGTDVREKQEVLQSEISMTFKDTQRGRESH
jgi:hypothetical protein